MSLQLMLIWPKSCPEIQLEYFSRYVKIFNFTSLAITYLLLLNKFVPLQAKKNFFFRGRTDLPVMYGRTYLPVWTDVPVRMYVPTCMDGCTYLHRRMYLHVRADVPTQHRKQLAFSYYCNISQVYASDSQTSLDLRPCTHEFKLKSIKNKRIICCMKNFYGSFVSYKFTKKKYVTVAGEKKGGDFIFSLKIIKSA